MKLEFGRGGEMKRLKRCKKCGYLSCVCDYNFKIGGTDNRGNRLLSEECGFGYGENYRMMEKILYSNGSAIRFKVYP